MLKPFIGYLRYIISNEKSFLKSLKAIIGYYPLSTTYYKLAFIHKSAGMVSEKGHVINNERLEYLGDAILDAVISDYLFHSFPYEDEGFLTQMRSKIVNGDKLQELALQTGIDDLVKANTSNVRGRRRISEDAFEAFIGALYLDLGYKQTTRYIIKNIVRKLLDMERLENINTNYKSQLIEWAQKYKKQLTFFTDIDANDPKTFVSYVIIEEESFGSGTGASKKEAEQLAAQNTLKMVEK